MATNIRLAQETFCYEFDVLLYITRLRSQYAYMQSHETSFKCSFYWTIAMKIATLPKISQIISDLRR